MSFMRVRCKSLRCMTGIWAHFDLPMRAAAGRPASPTGASLAIVNTEAATVKTAGMAALQQTCEKQVDVSPRKPLWRRLEAVGTPDLSHIIKWRPPYQPRRRVE